MFLSGIYQNGEVTFFKATWGYILILIFLIIEKVCLSWIYNRFGCDEVACELISKFEKRLKQIDNQIFDTERDINNAEILDKRMKMKVRQNQVKKKQKP